MIALKTLVKEIAPTHTQAQGDTEPSTTGESNEKILDEILKVLTAMREKYSIAVQSHPERIKEFRIFLEDVARVLDKYGVTPDINTRI